jgi:hypothetical protein
LSAAESRLRCNHLSEVSFGAKLNATPFMQ